MKIKVTDADGPPLDWMVAMALGTPHFWFVTKNGKPAGPGVVLKGNSDYSNKEVSYSTNVAHGGGIQELAGIATRKLSNGTWLAMLSSDLGDGDGAHWNMYTFNDVPKTASTSRQCRFEGQTQLKAVCRCFVASVLGAVVEVPDELSLCISNLDCANHSITETEG